MKPPTGSLCQSLVMTNPLYWLDPPVVNATPDIIQSHDRARPLRSCHHQRQTPTRKPGYTIVRKRWAPQLGNIIGIETGKGCTNKVKRQHYWLGIWWGPHPHESGAASICATAKAKFMWSGHGIASQGPLSLYTVPVHMVQHVNKSLSKLRTLVSVFVDCSMTLQATDVCK